MSKYLGPIHYYLYNKIIFQDKLCRFILEAFNINDSSLVKNYQPLEEVIDEANIHGFLQNEIKEAEVRYARLLKQITDIDKLLNICYSFGCLNSFDYNITVKEAFKGFDSLFLNGMPCDRIISIIEASDDVIRWFEVRDIHLDNFKEVGMDTTLYFKTRIKVMEGLLSESNLTIALNKYEYILRAIEK